MNPGLKQGFVRLDSLAHRILQCVLLIGPATEAEISEELGCDRRHTATILIKLVKTGLIFRHGKIHAYKYGGRTKMVFGLEPRSKPIPYKRATPIERSKRYRDKLKSDAKIALIRVPSVFDFRGEINIQS
ncbi:hypothetical protein UFOVP2_11 [uncultured Caudovirales phage]|uniref:Uncharacterized protein n=1 Tax=uncultured Caudovirales phage TaxID=2100421 RepID=A0A6J5KHG5_9CAUD|nr:hypothetical protein UFOVP2_11 [uncultured Caudovirales phage]